MATPRSTGGPTTAGPAARSPMRTRFREQVREDVKAAALHQIADGGATAVSVNAIAKQLGVSGPALYRYFANRDELLAEIVVDTYRDFAETLTAATARDRGHPPHERLRAFAERWRAFARTEPHRYPLLFTAPVPGYDAHTESLATAARDVMAAGRDVVADLVPEDSDEQQLDLALRIWGRLHGFVALELGGNFTAMGVDADALFEHEVESLLR